MIRDTGLASSTEPSFALDGVGTDASVSDGIPLSGGEGDYEAECVFLLDSLSRSYLQLTTYSYN